ncbi:MAG: thermonuclease family protein [Sphingomonadales bacterium]
MGQVLRFRRRRRLPRVGAGALPLTIMLFLVAFGAYVQLDHRTDKDRPFKEITTPFSKCAWPRINCVIDGDTFYLHGERIRIADIDTPETSNPQCTHEARLGARATERLHDLLNAGPFVLESWPGRDRDQYGRLLRIVIRDGQSLGNVMVNEGLARQWGGRRQSWC